MSPRRTVPIAAPGAMPSAPSHPPAAVVDGAGVTIVAGGAVVGTSAEVVVMAVGTVVAVGVDVVVARSTVVDTACDPVDSLSLQLANNPEMATTESATNLLKSITIYSSVRCGEDHVFAASLHFSEMISRLLRGRP